MAEIVTITTLCYPVTSTFKHFQCNGFCDICVNGVI